MWSSPALTASILDDKGEIRVIYELHTCPLTASILDDKGPALYPVVYESLLYRTTRYTVIERYRPNPNWIYSHRAVPHIDER